MQKRVPGKLIKLSDMDIPSETRSIYKLDTNVTAAPDAPRIHGGTALDKIFKNMPVVDRATILDKIHKMGLNQDKK